MYVYVGPRAYAVCVNQRTTLVVLPQVLSTHFETGTRDTGLELIRYIRLAGQGQEALGIFLFLLPHPPVQG